MAFSVDVYVLNNTTLATISPDAQINQHESPITAAQNVTVDAETDVETLNLFGDSLPILLQNLSYPRNSNPYGSSGAKTGVGGALLGLVYVNTTHAEIAGGARVQGYNIDVTAATHLLDIGIGAAWGMAGQTAIDGSATVVVLVDTTAADIAAGAMIDAGGEVSVSALDNSINVNVAGSVLTGSNTGIGVSFGVNIIERNTSAYIGAPDGATPTGAPAVIEAPAGVTVTATNSGLNIGLALAGSFINTSSGSGSGSDDEGEDQPGEDPPSQEESGVSFNNEPISADDFSEPSPRAPICRPSSPSPRPANRSPATW